VSGGVADGVWRAVVTDPAVVAAVKASGSLFVNGERRGLVRTKTLRWEAPLVEGKNMEENKYGFVYSEGDIPSGWNLTDAAVSRWTVGAFHSWTKAYHKVRKVFPANRTILFHSKAVFSYGDFLYCSEKRYYIEGASDLSHSPGDWSWVESGDGVEITYSPLSGESVGSVVVPVASSTIMVTGTKGIAFRNLHFGFTAADCGEGSCDQDQASFAPGCLSIVRADNALVSNCTFTAVEGFGIKISGGAMVERVLVKGAGAGGVLVHGMRKTATVTNSRVEGFGLRYPAGAGVTMADAPNGTVSHCEISGGLSNGLQGGFSDDQSQGLRYEYNIIRDNGRSDDSGVCDFGGIHVGNSKSKHSTAYIRYNVFQNITAYANGGCGIYLDVSSSGWRVEGNLVHSTVTDSLYWHMNPGIPVMNTVPTTFVNNVFIYNGTQNHFYAKKTNKILDWTGYTRATFERNVVVADTGTYAYQPVLFGGLPCAREETPSDNCTLNYIDNFRPATLGQNVYFNTSGAVGSTFPSQTGSTGSWAEWQRAGFDGTSMVNVDPEIDGHGSVTSSKVLAMGILPLGPELAKAGPDW